MGRYDDIINCPRHRSARHAPMSSSARAAQFAAFAALSGYGDAIDEQGRLTDRQLIPDSDVQEEINRALMYLHDHPAEAVIVYFVHDERKAGGKYVIARGMVKRVDEYMGCVVMDDGTRIPVEDIYSVEAKA